jgi:hypothetical protein
MTSISEESVPLRPESIVDLVWGLSLFFSQDEQERRYGEDLKKKWDELSDRYNADKKALRYLDNVNATMSGALYDLARLRQETRDQFSFLEDLKNRRIRDLDDLANLSKDAQSIAARIVGVSVGGGLTLIQSASNVFGTRETAIAIVGAGAAYFVLEVVLRLYRSLNAPRVLKESQKEKEIFLVNQFQPKSEKLLADLLTKISDISKEIYGAKFALQPGLVKTLSAGSAVLHSSLIITGSSGPIIKQAEQ